MLPRAEAAAALEGARIELGAAAHLVGDEVLGKGTSGGLGEPVGRRRRGRIDGVARPWLGRAALSRRDRGSTRRRSRRGRRRGRMGLPAAGFPALRPGWRSRSSPGPGRRPAPGRRLRQRVRAPRRRRGARRRVSFNPLSGCRTFGESRGNLERLCKPCCLVQAVRSVPGGVDVGFGPLGSRPRDRDLRSRGGGLRGLAGDRAGGDRALRRAALVVAGAGGRVGAALRGLLGDGAVARATASSRRSLVLALVARRRSPTCGARLEGGGEALRAGWPVALVALVAASLPFIAEGHFGILGTSFNPDMSQHLLAADRLADGHSSQLLHQGYPLGPHAVVVALNKGLGIGLVQGFSGLTVAVAVLAPLTALAAFRRAAGAAAHRRRPGRRPRLRGRLLLRPGRLQGDDRGAPAARLRPRPARGAGRGPAWRALPLRFVPAALIAVGAVYAYSFPGLLWLAGDLRPLAARRSDPGASRRRRQDRRLPARSCSRPSSSRSWSPPRSAA